MIFIKALLITAGLFASCTLYFVLAILFYKLVDCVNDNFGYGEWLIDFYLDRDFVSELLFPFLAMAWLLCGFLVLPYRIALKIFGETEYGL